MIHEPLFFGVTSRNILKTTKRPPHLSTSIFIHKKPFSSSLTQIDYTRSTNVTCMHVCMYVYVCVCMYMYVCMHVYACMHVCMYVCMYVSMHACTYVQVYLCVCVCVCVSNLVPLYQSAQENDGIESKLRDMTHT